jgi:hypothetical protein
MGSLPEEPARRETAARDRVEVPREQIERLRERPTAGEEAPSWLMITRETVERSRLGLGARLLDAFMGCPHP